MINKKYLTWFSVYYLTTLMIPNIKADFRKVISNLPEYKVLTIKSGKQSLTRHFSDTILKEYGFIEFTRWEIHPGDAILEVYEMKDTQAAFGVFSIWEIGKRKLGNRIPIGIENLQIGNSVAFWRGHYFFILISPISTDKVISVFPVRLKKAIDERNLHPASVFQLPTRNLIRSSIRFYLGRKAMDQNPIIPSQLSSTLGFEDNAEVSFATYKPNGFGLLLVAYPTASVANKYAIKIQDFLQSMISKNGIYMKRSGPLLGLFLGPLDAATEVLENLQYQANVKWVYEKDFVLRKIEKKRSEVVTFLGVISQSVVSTGILILIVFVLGLSTGLLRVVIIRMFPNLRYRHENIYLNLGSQKS